MIHSYDVETAQEIGVIPAVILYNIVFWIAQNAANDNNYYDGEYWTYNSVRAYSDLFPEFSKKQIESSMKKLRESGYLKVGNYNTMHYDRTLWYALTDKGKAIAKRINLSDAFRPQGKSISPTGEINFAHRGNQFPLQGEPIPDINTDINTDSISVPKSAFGKIDFKAIVEKFNTICVSMPNVKLLSDSRKQAVRNAAECLSQAGMDFESYFRKVEKSDFLSGRKDWKGATFDWIMKRTNMIKVIEGNYDNRNNDKPKSDPYGYGAIDIDADTII